MFPVVPRASSWWHLRCPEQEKRPCLWGVSSSRNTYICCEGISSCKRIIWYVYLQNYYVSTVKNFLCLKCHLWVFNLKLWFVCRFHSRSEVQHRWPGLPSVCVWPLADPSRRPIWCQQQARTGRSRDPQAQRPEGGHPRFRQLPGQTIISHRLKG